MEYNDLSTQDYVNILENYNLPIPTKKNEIKIKAEQIIADKLCGCIKKVSKKSPTIKESKAIGICTKSIINAKGLVRKSFKCKRSKRNITLKKRYHKKSRSKKNNKKKTSSNKTTKIKK